MYSTFFGESEELYLYHSGKGHLDGGHSGRYPWGSGKNPYQDDKSSWAAMNNSYISNGMSIEERAAAFGMTLAEYKSRDAMTRNKELVAAGKSEKERASEFGLSIRQLRQSLAIGKAESDMANTSTALKLKATGMSTMAIAKEMGEAESTVRGWLKNADNKKQSDINLLSDALAKELETKEYVQVGSGVELYYNTTRTKLDNALYNLEQQGYLLTDVQVEQQGMNGQKTTVKVLGKPGTTYVDVKNNLSKIELPFETSINKETGSVEMLEYPKSLDSSRIKIQYKDEPDMHGVTGEERDGVMFIRRGVDDVSLGASNYAQVRIMVDDKYYLKGIAMYSDDMPDGKDIVFYTNKKQGTALEDVLKPLKVDVETGEISKKPQAVFGATIKAGGQMHYTDADGKIQLGVVNKVNEEGDWGEWSKTLASQMLSKQSKTLAKQQLDLDYQRRVLEFQEIKEINNPAVKANFINSFADTCDAAAVDLKAAAMPGQRTQVLLPLPEISDKEIYAPNFNNGDRVVLIRYPHAGLFEIPELVVNNNNKAGKSLIGAAKDAVGINPNTAKKLSGADFDGDTVLVIPNNEGKIKTKDPLPGLVDFDPKQYKYSDDYDGPGLMTKDATKQQEMGRISNLITDMQLRAAPDSELERATRHSMVVIDAKKHRLNYKQSEKDNGIDELRKKYQMKDEETGKYGGAATLISRASAEERVSVRKAGGYLYDDNGERIKNSLGKDKIFYVDPSTGEKLYRVTPEYYTKYKIKVKNPDTGKMKTEWVTKSALNKQYKDADILDMKQVERTGTSTKMAEAKDAKSLSSGTVMEGIYADYANKCKALANEARKESLKVPTSTPINKEAKVKYAAEVASLNAKLKIAKKNEPLERQANIIASANVDARLSNADDTSNAAKRKIATQELTAARAAVGASGKKTKIEITDAEWEAIQNNAISYNQQTQIVRYANKDVLREKATPKVKSRGLQKAEISLIKSMYRSGHTQQEIADAFDISISSVASYIKE